MLAWFIPLPRGAEDVPAGTTAKPVYAAPEKVMAGGRPVDPFGMPSPMWGDFDGDGDLDIGISHINEPVSIYQNQHHFPKIH